MRLGVTGQRGRSHVSCVAQEGMPIVFAEELTDYNSMINQAHLSGKAEGRLVAVLAGPRAGIHMASGPNPADRWVQLSTLNSVAEEEFVVSEFDDLIDIGFGEGFYNFFEVVDSRIATKVIQTPMKTVGGTYVFRCKFSTSFSVRKKTPGVPEAMEDFPFILKLTNVLEGDQYYKVDDAHFNIFANTGGRAVGVVDVPNTRTNYIPVKAYISTQVTGNLNFNLSLEWTSTLDLQGDTDE